MAFNNTKRHLSNVKSWKEKLDSNITYTETLHTQKHNIHRNITYTESKYYFLGVGWKANVLPEDHPVSQYEFDVLIGADGKRNTLEGLYYYCFSFLKIVDF